LKSKAHKSLYTAVTSFIWLLKADHFFEKSITAVESHTARLFLESLLQLLCGFIIF